MKKISIILLCTILFYSCNKSKENETNIIGHWAENKATLSKYVKGQPPEFQDSNSNLYTSLYIQFSNGGNGYSMNGVYPYSSFTYSITGNILKIDGVQSDTIKTLTSHNLVIRTAVFTDVQSGTYRFIDTYYSK